LKSDNFYIVVPTHDILDGGTHTGSLLYEEVPCPRSTNSFNFTNYDGGVLYSRLVYLLICLAD
jgi:hypothetical protein